MDPADHGVYDILETVPGTHKQYPVTYRSIKERTFLAGPLGGRQEGASTRDVPLTFPPPAIDGNIVAGGVLPKGRPFTHPAGPRAATWPRPACRGRSTGCRGPPYRNRPEPFLAEAFDITNKRSKATE